MDRDSTYRHCPSAKSVSNANEDFPDPDTPVTAVTRLCGMQREMFFRYFCLAPSTTRDSEGDADAIGLGTSAVCLVDDLPSYQAVSDTTSIMVQECPWWWELWFVLGIATWDERM